MSVFPRRRFSIAIRLTADYADATDKCKKNLRNPQYQRDPRLKNKTCFSGAALDPADSFHSLATGRVRPTGGQERDRAFGIALGNDCDHSYSHVEDLIHLGRTHAAVLPHDVENS